MGLTIRLYVRVGHPIGELKHRAYEWPVWMPLPEAGDFVTVGEDELEVDHREFFPEAAPYVGISFKPIDDELETEGWS